MEIRVTIVSVTALWFTIIAENAREENKPFWNARCTSVVFAAALLNATWIEILENVKQ